MTITTPCHREPTPLERAVIGREVQDIFLTRGCLMVRFADGGEELFASDARVRTLVTHSLPSEIGLQITR